MEPATFGCIARCSNQLNQPARAPQLLLSCPPSLTLLNSLPSTAPSSSLKKKRETQLTFSPPLGMLTGARALLFPAGGSKERGTLGLIYWAPTPNTYTHCFQTLTQTVYLPKLLVFHVGKALQNSGRESTPGDPALQGVLSR